MARETSGETKSLLRRIAVKYRNRVLVALTFMRYGPSTAQIVAEILTAPPKTTPETPDRG